MNSTFRAGAARIDISPRPGVDLTGFIVRTGPNTGVHDPVQARALALDDGTARLMLVACDLLGLEAATIASLRRAIESATGVPAAHIMIACSHTHAGPACMFLRNAGAIDSGWLTELPGKLATVAKNALALAQPVTARSGRTRCEGISRNRRRHDGPLDASLDLLCLESASGRTVATVFNFACHPITTGPGNLQVSADFPGVACAEIENRAGGIAFFLNGASADVNPATSSNQLDCRDGNFEDMQQNGRTLAAAALAHYPKLQPMSVSPLSARSIEFDLPLAAPPSIEELRAAAVQQYAELADPVERGDDSAWRQASAFLQWSMATLGEYRLGGVRACVPIELQLLQFGSLALIGVPGELFTSLGTVIREDAPPASCFLATYTNGNIGYIGPRGEYSDPGYELGAAYHYYGYPAPLAPGAGEMLVEAARRLLETLQ